MKKNYFLLLITLPIIFSSMVYSQDSFPEWAKGIVWYQIFPERFADGDKKNDSTLIDKIKLESRKDIPDWHVSRWTSNWFAQSNWEKQLGGSYRRNLNLRRYGGDLQGIIDHLGYLKNLGVGAIYLNPIFDAVSLHKYDGSTYHHIDVNFGPDPEGDKKLIATEIPDDPSTWVWTSADKLFLKLIKEVHKRGMKIIIDGVFNHTGTQFWAFQDIIKNGEKSKFKNWYKIKSFGDPNNNDKGFDYAGWNGIKSLPVFNRTKNDLNAGPKQYIFNATKRWMDPDGSPSDGIDGWRLDVANEIPLGFWKDWRGLVKSINPQAIIIGELWKLSPQFVSKDGPFDALMNYNFAFAVNDFFIARKKRITVSEFIEELQKIDQTYPQKNLYLLQNLVDSHDTERLSSMIANPDRRYDTGANPENPNYNPGKPSAKDYEMQKLILAFQMTYRGAPMIYYGDEVGMWGADDPDDRKPMVWDNLKYDDEVITPASGYKKGFGAYKVEQNKNLLSFYKKMIGIRNNNPALQYGSLAFIYSNDPKETFAFLREFGKEKIIVVFNLGKNFANFELPFAGKNDSYKELISGEAGSLINSGNGGEALMIQIPSNSVKIFRILSVEKK
ncbi:MAG: glycoside hydrolase family 13 protein [Ignavibacteriaceae bacterium]